MARILGDTPRKVGSNAVEPPVTGSTEGTATSTQTTSTTTSDDFDVRRDGEAPQLSTTAPEEETPQELRAELLQRHVTERRPRKKAAPQTVATTPPAQSSGQPNRTARLRNRAAENLVRARVDANLTEPAASSPAPFGVTGLGMGSGASTDPTELRAKLTGSAGWAELSEADRTTLTERFDVEGPAGTGMQMRVGGLMNHPRWDAAGTAGQAEALRRLAAQPAPQGGMGMGIAMGGMRPADPGPAPSVRQTQADLRASDGFRALSETEQDQLTARVGLDGPRGETTRRTVQQTMGTPEWALMDAGGRAQQLRQAQMSADHMARFPSADRVVEGLEASPGFQAMDAEARTALRERVEAPGEMALRSRLGDALELPEFERASPQRQADLLQQIADDTPVFRLPAPGTPNAGGLTGLGGMMGGPAREAPPVPSAQQLRGQLRDSGALRHLAADERAALTARLDATDGAGEALRSTLDRTLDSPQWALRTSEERAQSLRGYLGDTRSWPTSGEASPGTQGMRPRSELLPGDAMDRIRALPGYAQLNDAEQTRFEGLMNGERNPLSREARRQASDLAYGLEPDTPETQAAGLRRFLREGPHIPGNMDSIDITQTQRFEPEFGATRAAPDFEFRGTTADATVQTVRINGHSVDIYAPAGQPDLPEDAPHLPSVEDIASALAHLPPESLETVQRVVINPVRNPDDGYWAEQMEIPGFRANATAGRGGNMTFYPMTQEMTREELGDVARHEAGHFNSFDTLYENEDSWQASIPNWAYGSVPDWEDWNAAARGDGTMASRYGSENQDEDYAETYALYMGTRGTPLHDEYRQVFPNRFELLDGLVEDPD